MERLIASTQLNRVFMEQPVQVTYTAGLFFLFHNARVVAQLADSEALNFISSDREIRLELAVPIWQAAVGLVGAIVVVIGGVIMLRPSRRGYFYWTADVVEVPEVCLRAFADSTTIPPWFFNVHFFDGDITNKAEPVDLRLVPIQSIAFSPLPETGGSAVVSQARTSLADLTKKKQLEQETG